MNSTASYCCHVNKLLFPVSSCWYFMECMFALLLLSSTSLWLFVHLHMSSICSTLDFGAAACPFGLSYVEIVES